jgi:DNA-nicking Smr family endonuclease
MVAEARPVAPATPAARKRAMRDVAGSGLDGRTEERLRRGQLEPEARLDLHGLTEREAHQTLLTFLRTARLRGYRLALIVTGKGARVAPDQPFDMELNYRSRGILKAVVPRWLKETAFAPLVAGTRAAHRKHGGDGALYVYLRRRE